MSIGARAHDIRTTGRGWHTALVAVLACAACLAPAAADAALLNRVFSGTVNMPDSATPTQIALTGVDISKAFVVCSSRSEKDEPRLALFTCDLNNNGVGGTARLTITPGVKPGNTTTWVQYYVAEFLAGVSVQSGTATFSGTGLAPTVASTPSLGAVDCAKSFVLTSLRTTESASDGDERWGVRATLGTAAAPCTSGTTTSLELSRLEGAGGRTLNVAWQVVTYEGAFVQRGTSCIGGAGATPACPTAAGATNGRTNRITLGTGVDTTKSFILFTRQTGTAVGGVEGEHMVRAEFLSTGASVTGVQFARSSTATANNHHVGISWEVVSLSDGTTVQTSGAAPAALASGTTAISPNLSTLVDTTRTLAFFSVSGGVAGSTGSLDDLGTTATIAGSDGTAQSEIRFTRNTSSDGTSIAWFAVSFFRCNTASGIAHDTLCTVGASAAGTDATVNWSSVNAALILRSTSTISAVPVNGTSYTAGQTIAGVSVVYSGSAATDTTFPETGLTQGTTYFYKVWAKGGAVGACATAPCYVGGAEVRITPRANTAWSSVVVGGAALNPAVAGTVAARMSFGSNAGKLISVDSASGVWTGVPGNTLSPVQGSVSVFPRGAGETVVGGDQSGWVYSVDTATGSVNWVRKLNADAIQAPVSTALRSFFGFNAGWATAYPGTYDVIFVATMNNTGTGGLTNNKVFALRSDTGAVLWTFSPATLSAGVCPAGCVMDQVLGQPWVDYERARLYVASRAGSAGTQDSLWVLDLLNSGALLAKFGGADFTTGPTQSWDLNSLFVGDEAGVLHIVDLNALTKTTNSIAAGSAFKGFVWEDFNEAQAGRLYFVTTDGNVWALATPTSPAFDWKTKPVAAGTVSELLPGLTALWVGGSDGWLYQLNLTTGAPEGAAFVVGDGTLSVGPVSTETTDELYAATTDGTVYKIGLTGGSLP